MQIQQTHFDKTRNLHNDTNTSEVSGIPYPDRQRVLVKAMRVYPLIKKWAAPFPVLLPTRFASMALACSAIAPDADDLVVTHLAVFSLVLFAVDDLADGLVGNYRDEELEKLFRLNIEIVETVAAGQHVAFPTVAATADAHQSQSEHQEQGAWEQTLAALEKICYEMSTYSAARQFYPYFARRYRLAKEGMRQELLWRHSLKLDPNTLPSYLSYMVTGQETIEAPLVMAALLLMIGQPISQTGQSIEEALDTILTPLARAIRLANDIRSLERDRLEGKANALLILMKEGAETEAASGTGGMGEKDAETVALAHLDGYIAKLEELLAAYQKQTSSGLTQTWLDSVRRCAHFARDYYLTREFHQFTKDQLKALEQAAALGSAVAIVQPAAGSDLDLSQ